MVVFYLPNLDFSRSVGKGNCARYVKKGWYITVYSYISLIITPVIPVAMLFAMNIIIIKAVWKSQQMHNQNQTGKQNTNTEMQLTIMLILVSSLFVILLLPFEIREIYYTIFSKDATPKQYAIFTFIFDVTHVSLRLRVQNAVPAEPCVGKLGISLVLLNFLHCNFRLWFKTP